MANIASVFHWSLESLERMTPGELAQWHQLAVERSGAEGS